MTLYWNGDRIKDELKKAVVEGCLDTAQQILADAQRKAPRMTGTLKRSGVISFKILNPDVIYKSAQAEGYSYKKPRVGKLTNKIYISFNTPYAHRQHEDLNLSHDGTGTYYTSGGKKEYIKSGEPKFLEKAWNDNIKNIYGNVAYQCKKQGLQ